MRVWSRRSALRASAVPDHLSRLRKASPRKGSDSVHTLGEACAVTRCVRLLLSFSKPLIRPLLTAAFDPFRTLGSDLNGYRGAQLRRVQARHWLGGWLRRCQAERGQGDWQPLRARRYDNA